MTELLNELANLFSRAHPLTQFGVLLALIVVIIIVVLQHFRGNGRMGRLKLDRDRLRIEARDKELTLRELRGKLAGSEALANQLYEKNQQATEEHGRMFQALAQAESSKTETQMQLDICRQELEALQMRFDALQKIDADVWKEPTPAGAVLPQFVPREERKTRFVAFLNLKGGVGKSTLVANLAGAYSTGVTGNSLNVLVVDLDYQGTLGNMCVASKELLDFRSKTNNRTSQQLLADIAEAPASVLQPLLATFDGSCAKGRVIVADEGLDHIDFRRQACFAVERCEVRFHHRRLFHDRFVFDRFDLVFFDCPPRLTTSTVNALVTSDFIVIPTSLHRNDVDAVPRTLRWLDKLHEMPTFQAKLAGVILNRTFRKATLEEGLTRDERVVLAPLMANVQRAVPTGGGVMTHAVPNSSDVARFANGSIPIGTQPEGHRLYGDVARELRQRIL
jgi:cellulose biosynthesis protein BcsQ